MALVSHFDEIRFWISKNPFLTDKIILCGVCFIFYV